MQRLIRVREEYFVKYCARMLSGGGDSHNIEYYRVFINEESKVMGTDIQGLLTRKLSLDFRTRLNTLTTLIAI